MSRIKQLIDIDNNEPEIDALMEAGIAYDAEPVDVPDEYFAINDIYRALNVLKTCLIAPSEARELRDMAQQLNKLADKAEKPF